MKNYVLFVEILASALLVSSYPYDVERWSPEEVAYLLSAKALEYPDDPVQDTDFGTENLGLGQVSAVGVDSKSDLYVFHRANRPWMDDTFAETGNVLSTSARAPITKDTICKLNPVTGGLISSFGGNIFNVPHGLTVDGNDNIWVTDVGRHQVFRFPKNATTPDLVIGEKFVPGNDDNHFCKPTDVAVASNGDFFVSDGYCNSRVLKFSKDGKMMVKWGAEVVNDDLTPFTMNIPHSLTLVEELDLVCVADREDSRVLCYNAGLQDNKTTGKLNRTLVPQGDLGKVFAVYYNKADKDVIVAAEIARYPFEQDGEEIFPARAFTYGMDGQQKTAWAYITPNVASDGPSLIHDLCASKNGLDFYLADILQQQVVKYSKNKPTMTA